MKRGARARSQPRARGDCVPARRRRAVRVGAGPRPGRYAELAATVGALTAGQESLAGQAAALEGRAKELDGAVAASPALLAVVRFRGDEVAGCGRESFLCGPETDLAAVARLADGRARGAAPRCAAAAAAVGARRDGALRARGAARPADGPRARPRPLRRVTAAVGPAGARHPLRRVGPSL